MNIGCDARKSLDEPIDPSGQICVGVCGFCRPQAELFQRFRLLEVQQTFYWPPQRKTVERWRAKAGDDFEFTLKAFQVITHTSASPTYRRARLSTSELALCGNFGDTPVVRDAWHSTFELANALKANVVVFQCPPRFDATSVNIAQLRRFFHWTQRGRLLFAWEPRHHSWTSDLVLEICRELDLIHAVDPLEQLSAWGRPKYYRLHGTSMGNFRYEYGHPYSNTELQEIHRRCLPGPTYCLFNNKQMAEDTLRFGELLKSSAKCVECSPL